MSYYNLLEILTLENIYKFKLALFIHKINNDPTNIPAIFSGTLIVLSREPSGVMTRTTEDASTIEHSVQVADLATKDSIVAVAAEDDSHYDYYLLKASSNGVISLQENFEDPYSGSIYSKGEAVLLGNFFLRENIIDRAYKLDDKVAGVFPGTVRYICGPLVSKRRRARPIYQVPLDEHEQILASL